MLKRLDIENFRVLEDFHVERLGKVNLVVGRNNAGKSTVLEAIRIFAGNAQRTLLEKIAKEHDERYRMDETTSRLPFEDFFSHNAKIGNKTGKILIGDKTHPEDHITIESAYLREYQEVIIEEEGPPYTVTKRRRIDNPSQIKAEETLRHALVISKSENSYNIVLDTTSRPTRQLDRLATYPCSLVPTHLASMDELAQAWDEIVFSKNELLIRDAIKFISPDFEALTFVESEEYDLDKIRSGPYSRRRLRRVPVVKTTGVEGARPLKSLGDGVARVFQLSLKLLESRNGFLLIDEFENGFHYTVQENIWNFVFQAAEKLNIQVFATTHSWDCIKSFAAVATNNDSSNGLLFRVGKSVRKSDHGKVIATSFFGNELSNVTQSDLEVR